MRVQLIQMTKNPIEVMWTAARTCYASGSPIDIWNNKFGEKALKDGECYSTKHYEECTEKHWDLVEKVLKSGHQSIAEHVYFTFSIEGMSRACSHQLVRHRHCTFSQQSQRYVEIKESKEELLGVLDRYEGPEMDHLCNKYFETKNGVDRKMCIDALVNYRDLIENDYRKPEDARAVLPNATKTNIVMSCNLRELIYMCNLRLCTRAQYEIRDMFKSIVALVETEDRRIASLLVPQCEVLGLCTEHKCCGRKPTLEEVLEDHKIAEDFRNIAKKYHKEIQEQELRNKCGIIPSWQPPKYETVLSEEEWQTLESELVKPVKNGKLKEFMEDPRYDENK